MLTNTGSQWHGNSVILLAEEPGGANFICYLADILKDKGCSVALYACGSGLKFLQDRDVQVSSAPDTEMRSWLRDLQPDLLVVGTSANPESSIHMAVDASHELGIPSVGCVDAIMSAKLRFKGRSADPMRYAPDWLLVPDLATQKEYCDVNFPPSRIVVTGHPHYAAIARRGSDLMSRREALAEKHLGTPAPDGPVVVFVSEPTVPDENDYRATETLRGWGTTDHRTHVALQETLDALSGVAPNAYLILRLHVRNDESEFTGYAGHVDKISKGGDGLELCAVADLVVGMTSSLVFEAALIGRPTISVLVTQRERALIPQSVSDCLEPVFEASALRDAMARALAGQWDRGDVKSILPWNEGGKVTTFLAGLLKQKQHNSAPELQ